MPPKPPPPSTPTGPFAQPAEGPTVADAADLLRRAWGGAEPAHEPASACVDQMLDLSHAPDFAGAAALVPREAVSQAVVGERVAAYVSGSFARLLPDPAAMPDLWRLAAQARRGGEALGLLQALDGEAVAAWAVTGPRAERWARTEAARAALARPGRVLVLVFAPSRSDELAARAAAAFDLTPLESRVAEALLLAPTLALAADRAGVGRETARDAMDRVMAKTGARRSSEVVRKLVELMSAVHGDPEPSEAVLLDAFDLTPAEAAVAAKVVAGATQNQAAEALGLQPQTVRSYVKAVLAKTGAARTKDLVRLAAETQALSRLAAVAEPVFTSGAPPARLRILPRDDERGLAFLDYGPHSGKPAIVFHGFVAGRSLPPALARRLQARGYRPIVPQRPGFGLTSPAARPYLAETCNDLTALAERLQLRGIALFARDGGTAAALAFAAADPERIARAVLLNPRLPSGIDRSHRSGPVGRMARLILSQPQVIGALGEFIRHRTRSDYIETALRETLKALPGDLAALQDPAVRAQLVRDIQAQFAHGCAGYVAEHRLYAQDWRPPPVRGGGPWTIAYSGGLGLEPSHDPWLSLPGVRFTTLPEAGVLAQFTHAEELAALIAGDG